MLGKSLLVEILKKKGYEVYIISHTGALQNSLSYQLTIQDLPDYRFYAFFHCAAEVNVNLCERDFDLALSANYEYTKLLFKSVISEFYFYISTDSVYEGNIGNYSEASIPRPLNNYARSKFMGELVAANYTNNLYTIRTNIFGEKSKGSTSLFEWAKSDLLKGMKVPGFTNVFFNPISVQHLSLTMLAMLENKIKFGVYNIGSDCFMSKYEFLIRIAKSLGVSTQLVVPTEFVPSATVANRPINTTMNCDKIKQNICDLDLSFETSLMLLINGYAKN